jgi:hypothetical protein
MRHPAYLSLSGLALLTAFLGCSDPPTFIGDACQSDIAITVSAATGPQFDWTPTCAVGILHVTTEAGDPMWSISSKPQADFTPTNRIQGGVMYGTVPPDAQQVVQVVPLVPGETYRVLLDVINSEGEITLVGKNTFSGPAE